MKSLLRRCFSFSLPAATKFSAQATEVSLTANVLRVHPFADGIFIIALRTT
jgi:hypothetical protein